MGAGATDLRDEVRWPVLPVVPRARSVVAVPGPVDVEVWADVEAEDEVVREVGVERLLPT